MPNNMPENRFDRYKLDFSKEGIQKSKTFRVSTGFKNLDKLIQGGLGAELIVLGAISSLGKSTFALQMAQQISSRNIPVLYFSLEMSKQNISLKLSSRTAFEMVKKDAEYAEAKKKALSPSEISGKYVVEGEKELLRDAALEKCSEEFYAFFRRGRCVILFARHLKNIGNGREISVFGVERFKNVGDKAGKQRSCS